MLKHIMNVALAVMLGVAVMLLPLMTLGYQIGFTDSRPWHGEAEKAFTSSSEERMAGNITREEISTAHGYEDLSMRFASSLPYATFIVSIGLAAAMVVLILAKRRL